VSGIEKNCRIFHQSVSSAGGMTTEDESIYEIMETSDDTSGVGVSDIMLDNNIYQLYERAVDNLKDAQLGSNSFIIMDVD